MTEQTTNAPPIVLIHGLWMTARSWDRWVEYYRAKDMKSSCRRTRFEIEVEALRKARDHRRGVRPRNARSSQRGGRGSGTSADHHGPLLRRDFTQLLVNRGLGAAA